MRCTTETHDSPYSNKNVQVGFLCYDLQPFTEDCLYRIAQAVSPIRLKAYPSFYHSNQDNSRIPYRPSFLKGKHLGVNVAGSTPEGFTSNANLKAAWDCVRESNIVVLFGLQGGTALLAGLFSIFMRRTVISVNQTLPVVWERRRRWWIRRLKQWLLNRCKFHIYQTQATKEVITSLYNIGEKHLFYAPFEAGATWFDAILQSRRNNRDKTRIDLGLADKVVFLFVGNLVFFKGIEDLIRAVSLMPEDANHVCIFAGPEVPNNKKDINYFLSEAHKLGIEQHVLFTGQLSAEKLADMYWAADVVVLPTHRDMAPKALVEAALARKPIITTNAHGWIGTLVHNEKNALVTDPGDIESLASAMKRLMNAQLRKDFGNRSREIVDAVCDPEKETEGFATAVRHALTEVHP
jgi:glycosyltransferase involved in cell wall biosynthesis